jgi:hypothetical protein
MGAPPYDGTRTEGGTARLRGVRPPWQPGQTGDPRGGAVSLLSLAARIRRASASEDRKGRADQVFNQDSYYVQGISTTGLKT